MNKDRRGATIRCPKCKAVSVEDTGLTLWCYYDLSCGWVQNDEKTDGEYLHLVKTMEE